jgi:hypothetical protein
LGSRTNSLDDYRIPNCRFRNHETLHRSRKGRYWVEHQSQWQGSKPYAEWISNAAQWLLANAHQLLADLAPLEEEVAE